jgi:hypothetical protein
MYTVSAIIIRGVTWCCIQRAYVNSGRTRQVWDHQPDLLYNQAVAESSYIAVLRYDSIYDDLVLYTIINGTDSGHT